MKLNLLLILSLLPSICSATSLPAWNVLNDTNSVSIDVLIGGALKSKEEYGPPYKLFEGDKERISAAEINIYSALKNKFEKEGFKVNEKGKWFGISVYGRPVAAIGCENLTLFLVEIVAYPHGNTVAGSPEYQMRWIDAIPDGQVEQKIIEGLLQVFYNLIKARSPAAKTQ